MASCFTNQKKTHTPRFAFVSLLLLLLFLFSNALNQVNGYPSACARSYWNGTVRATTTPTPSNLTQDHHPLAGYFAHAAMAGIEQRQKEKKKAEDEQEMVRCVHCCGMCCVLWCGVLLYCALCCVVCWFAVGMVRCYVVRRAVLCIRGVFDAMFCLLVCCGLVCLGVHFTARKPSQTLTRKPLTHANKMQMCIPVPGVAAAAAAAAAEQPEAQTRTPVPDGHPKPR